MLENERYRNVHDLRQDEQTQRDDYALFDLLTIFRPDVAGHLLDDVHARDPALDQAVHLVLAARVTGVPFANLNGGGCDWFSFISRIAFIGRIELWKAKKLEDDRDRRQRWTTRTEMTDEGQSETHRRKEKVKRLREASSQVQLLGYLLC